MPHVTPRPISAARCAPSRAEVGLVGRVPQLGDFLFKGLEPAIDRTHADTKQLCSELFVAVGGLQNPVDVLPLELTYGLFQRPRLFRRMSTLQEIRG